MAFFRSIGVFAVLGALFSLSSCSMLGLGGKEENPDADKGDPTGGFADYLAKGGSTDATTYNVTTPEDLARIDNGAEGEVYFTDPDNPEAEVEGITEAFESKHTGHRWLTNSVQATREARLDGLPLLVWFHNSTLSPDSKNVARGLLETQEFIDWTDGKAICLCLDAGRGLKDSSASGQVATNYHKVNRMRGMYGLKSYPAFVVMSAHGKPALTIDGFDGYIGELERNLKDGIGKAAASYDLYKEELKAKGFRDWRSRDGSRTIFAKLTRFDQKQDMIYLKDAGGKQYRVHESKFHDDDVDYIEYNLRTGGPKY